MASQIYGVSQITGIPEELLFIVDCMEKTDSCLPVRIMLGSLAGVLMLTHEGDIAACQTCPTFTGITQFTPR